MIYLIASAAFVFVILLFVIAAMTYEQRAAGSVSLRAIETYTWHDDQLVTQQASFVDRVMAPMLGHMTVLGRRMTAEGYVDNVRRKLMLAGRRDAGEVDRYLSRRVLCLVAAVLAIVLIHFVVFHGSSGDMGKQLIVVALLAFSGYSLPDARLNAAVSARQKQVRRSLPDILDLLTISVEAGLGFEQAIDRITESVPGPLSDEFNRMIGEIRAGASRGDALRGIEQRTGVDEVKSFVMSMVQADTFGVSIGRVLRAQADEMRIKRRQLAQEAAQKAPVKMLIPMTFLIFPALFVVVLGPALINIAQNF